MKRLKRHQKRRGAALVEMALVLPIFVTVVLGIVEFGRAMMVAQMCTNAAREGVRLAVLDSSTNAEVDQAVRDLMVSAAGVAAADVVGQITITPAPGNPDPSNNLALAGTRDLVRVRVGVPFDKVAYVGGDWLAGKTLRSEAAMRHE